MKNSKSYTVKSLWGIPRTFFTIIKAFSKMNKNNDLGYELAFDLEHAEEDEEDKASTTGQSTGCSSLNPNFKPQKEFDYFKDQEEQSS